MPPTSRSPPRLRRALYLVTRRASAFAGAHHRARDEHRHHDDIRRLAVVCSPSELRDIMFCAHPGWISPCCWGFRRGRLRARPCIPGEAAAQGVLCRDALSRGSACCRRRIGRYGAALAGGAILLLPLVGRHRRGVVPGRRASLGFDFSRSEHSTRTRSAQCFPVSRGGLRWRSRRGEIAR
jgi:hypothetical protein